MDGQLIQRILEIVERDLRRRIIPELPSPASKLQIDYMIRLLQWVSMQAGPHDRLSEAHLKELDDLLTSKAVARLAPLPPAFYEAGPVPPEVDQLRRVAGLSRQNPQPFDRLVELEAAFVRALDAEQGDGLTDIYKGGKLNAGEVEDLPACDAATLTLYLRNRFDAPEATATDVTPLPGGFGKDTVLVNISGCGAFDGAAVVRKDFAVRAGPTPVTAEFPLLQALHRAGFPVAEPLWAEPDGSIVGGPFIVSRRIAGSSAASNWQESPELGRHFIDKFAGLLARLHGITVNTVFGSSEIGMRTAVQEHMTLYYNHYRARSRAINGRLEAGFAWLAANLSATDDRPACLVHGDVGFHNILMEGGEFNALLDWEFAHFGDPAADLGYCWQFIETLVSWDDFMAMYVRHGGVPVDYREASYYRVWGDIRNAAMGAGALGTIDLSDEADIRSPASALAFGPLLEIQALSGAARWNHVYGGQAAIGEQAA